MELNAKYGKQYVAGELSEDRGLAVTGSEIATILGQNRFETPRQCFFKKVFNVKTKDNPACAHGRASEPIAIERFQQKTGAKVFFVGFIRHPKYPWIGGTVDALAIMPDGRGVVVEVKCPLTRSVGDYVPAHYMGQVQTYMAITELDCLFVQWKPAYTTPKTKQQRPEKLMITSVKRDPGFFDGSLPVLWQFWSNVCAYREGRLPLAEPAAHVIWMAWNTYRNIAAVRNEDVARRNKETDLALRLCCAEWKLRRLPFVGVVEDVLAEMHQNKPEMPTLIEPIVVISAFAAPKRIDQ
jgi:putative phage-type endonuclease